MGRRDGADLAMAFYTLGFLGTLQYESMQGLLAISLEAAGDMRLPRWQRVRYAVLPKSANALLSQALFMFEYNVRASTIIGIVGAGGIGVYLGLYLQFFRYGRVLALLIMIILAVVIIIIIIIIIDSAAGAARRRFMEPASPMQRASWRDVLLLRPARPGG